VNTSKDLLFAILAMDSYNREYDAGINIGDIDVGLASYSDHEAAGITMEQYQAWQNVGFYAAVYNTPHGTVISYRGTDNPSVGGSGDIGTGWPVGAGFWGAPQAELELRWQSVHPLVELVHQYG
jgi:hypothetical protein